MSDSRPLLQVACLCAAWCGTCRDYEAAFCALAQEFPQARLHWIDVEEDAELVEAFDVENFPTLLIGVGGEPVFFGVVLPHAQTLQRLVRDAPQRRPLPAGGETAALRELLATLRARG